MGGVMVGGVKGGALVRGDIEGRNWNKYRGGAL